MQPNQSKNWIILPEIPEEVSASLSEYSPLLRQLLYNREVTNSAMAADFLNGSPTEEDPFHLADMEQAVDRLLRAAEAGEAVAVYGDYDVDGILSVVMLVKALRSLGGQAEYFIPDRMKDGYGLKIHHLPHILEMKANLLISVDCGIKATDLWRKLKKRGWRLSLPTIIILEMIYLRRWPSLIQSSNPLVIQIKSGRGGSSLQTYPGSFLRTGHQTGFDFFLTYGQHRTVADVASLKGENRILVREGMNKLKRSQNSGAKEFAGNFRNY